MRLGELLVLGSTMLKPLRGTINDYQGSGCALGMIYAAKGDGGLFRQQNTFFMDRTYQDEILPCGCNRVGSLMVGGGVIRFVASGQRWVIAGILVHIFNQHVCATEEEIRNGVKKWTIEQLADWLEKEEPKDPPQPSDPAEPKVPDPDTEQEPVAV